MNWLSISKELLKFVASTGAATVVTHAIKSTTPANIGTINKVLVGAGTFALSSMVASKVAAYVDEEVNKTFDQIVKKEEVIPANE